MITEDCECNEEVKRRIAIRKKVISKRGELLRGKMKFELKKRIVKTLIWSTERRNMDIQLLESSEMWI